MAIHGDTWQYMVIDGCTWQYMVIHGNTWLYMALHGNTWNTNTNMSCTWNANMKLSTGQSGLIRTLRQVIKSTVAWMHGSDNKLHKPTFTWKDCFTFPSILQIPENSCKLHCAKLSKRNFHFSKNPNHKTKQQIVCFVYASVVQSSPKTLHVLSSLASSQNTSTAWTGI